MHPSDEALYAECQLRNVTEGLYTYYDREQVLGQV
jgi:hypothetical protein